MQSTQENGPLKCDVTKLIADAAVRIAELKDHPLFQFDVEEIKKILFAYFYKSGKVVSDLIVLTDAAQVFAEIKGKTSEQIIESIKAPAESDEKSEDESTTEETSTKPPVSK